MSYLSLPVACQYEWNRYAKYDGELNFQTSSFLRDFEAYSACEAAPRRRGRPRTGRQPRPIRTYLCATCGVELKTSKGLHIHTRRHTGEKPYACDLCPKRFSCETLLTTHRVTHTGERRFVCDICGKAFTQRCTLVVHKRYHSGERPFHCDRCAKGFVTRTAMNNHRKNCSKFPTN